MKNVNLIDGKFNPTEAKETLVNMISSMIQFHINKNFISEYRTGKSEIKSLERIAELKEAKVNFLTLLLEAEKNNLVIELQSSVSISCAAKNQTETV